MSTLVKEAMQQVRRAVMDAVLRYRDELDLFGVNMPVISGQTRPEDVAYLKQNGLWVSLWFVQSEEKAQAYRDAHPNAFVTDHVTKARLGLKKNRK